jgi:hypothetical protein
MADPIDVELAREACPFLRPEAADHLEAFPVGVYCRLPDGRVRVPSRDELARFCAAGHYRDCPGFRSARQRERVLKTLAVA